MYRPRNLRATTRRTAPSSFSSVARFLPSPPSGVVRITRDDVLAAGGLPAAISAKLAAVMGAIAHVPAAPDRIDAGETFVTDPIPAGDALADSWDLTAAAQRHVVAHEKADRLHGDLAEIVEEHQRLDQAFTDTSAQYQAALQEVDASHKALQDLEDAVARRRRTA